MPVRTPSTPSVMLLIRRVANSSSLVGSPDEADMEAHMKVRSFTPALNTTSVSTGSSNWTNSQPAARSAISSLRRISTKSTARLSWVGQTEAQMPLTHMERASKYGPGSGTLIALWGGFREDWYLAST